MKTLIGLLAFTLFSTTVFSQSPTWQNYEPSSTHRYGMKNPDAPEQLDDFKPMMNFQESRRNMTSNWCPGKT